jgi:uncharacterized protein (TIGR03067 family)
MILRPAIAILFVLIAVAQEEPAATEFEGRWKAHDLEASGEKDDAQAIRRFRLNIVGDRADFEPAGTLWRARFRVDRTTSPKSIEFTLLEDGKPGRTVTGIYTFKDGDWLLCVPNFDAGIKGPPTEFKTRPGDGLVLMTLYRFVPKK